jgi:hypothetical protein
LGLIEIYFQENRENLGDSTYFTALCKPLYHHLKITEEKKQEIIKNIIRLGTSTSAFEVFDLIA